MLSIINAAEAQFRHESETRMREHAVLAAIRERRAQQDHAMGSVASISLASATAPQTSVRATREEWARPIGIKNGETAVCAA